ncbi:XTP/dITP diphosphatase [Paenibacillus sp. YYML68]|uniref:XTP/dITP diphosphatase n=1 Tax=Paenibacillus sp. YYML68 TaxID=2909250 RepID=UPI00248FAD4C|nr:XTP/dITP diphosphatase [Paenibacillus sp. YYML68]
MRLLGSELVLATTNAGKVKELAALLVEHGITVRSLKDYPDIPDIVEDGETFADNALIKARAVAKVLQLPVAADDSGLSVDRLNGAPGVYSARYAGKHGDDEANNRKLVEELLKLDVDGRPATPEGALSAAQFISAMALVGPDGETIALVEGECPGIIVAEAKGQGGFGYDPHFYVPQLGRTMAELSMEEKNGISHRGQALRKLLAAVL